MDGDPPISIYDARAAGKQAGQHPVIAKTLEVLQAIVARIPPSPSTSFSSPSRTLPTFRPLDDDDRSPAWPLVIAALCTCFVSPKEPDLAALAAVAAEPAHLGFKPVLMILRRTVSFERDEAELLEWVLALSLALVRMPQSAPLPSSTTANRLPSTSHHQHTPTASRRPSLRTTPLSDDDLPRPVESFSLPRAPARTRTPSSSPTPTPISLSEPSASAEERAEARRSRSMSASPEMPVKGEAASQETPSRANGGALEEKAEGARLSGCADETPRSALVERASNAGASASCRAASPGLLAPPARAGTGAATARSSSRKGKERALTPLDDGASDAEDALPDPADMFACGASSSAACAPSGATISTTDVVPRSPTKRARYVASSSDEEGAAGSSTGEGARRAPGSPTKKRVTARSTLVAPSGGGFEPRGARPETPRASTSTSTTEAGISSRTRGRARTQQQQPEEASPSKGRAHAATERRSAEEQGFPPEKDDPTDLDYAATPESPAKSPTKPKPASKKMATIPPDEAAASLRSVFTAATSASDPPRVRDWHLRPKVKDFTENRFTLSELGLAPCDALITTGFERGPAYDQARNLVRLDPALHFCSLSSDDGTGARALFEPGAPLAFVGTEAQLEELACAATDDRARWKLAVGIHVFVLAADAGTGQERLYGYMGRYRLASPCGGGRRERLHPGMHAELRRLLVAHASIDAEGGERAWSEAVLRDWGFRWARNADEAEEELREREEDDDPPRMWYAVLECYGFDDKRLRALQDAKKSSKARKGK